MARAVFQVQLDSDKTDVSTIKRSSGRSLQITEKTSDIISCLPFQKPKERVEPLRCGDTFSQIESCEVKNSETQNLVWVLLRFLPRDITTFPLSVFPNGQQTIPFWTGYFRETSPKSHSFK